jgi:hypothetical protein
MEGLCLAMAPSMAASSSSKSAVSGTPWNASPCSCALIAYITKPGKGARMEAPGTSQAIASREISSSEPLPSMMSKPAGMPA